MRVIAWDTETALIRPGVARPELACLTYSEDTYGEQARAAGYPTITIADSGLHPSEWPASIVDADAAVALVRGWLFDSTVTLVGQNVAYDFGVIMQTAPHLIPAVFAAYEQDRVCDTQIRQQLLDIAGGRHRGEFGKGGRWIKYDYGLDALSRRLLGWTLDKDTWRLRYGEFIGVPLDQWPEGARTYPLHDARATLGVYLAQEKHAEYLPEQYRLTRRALCLSLTEAWGLRTDPDGVERFAKSVEDEIAETQAELVRLGLVRPNGVRDTKAAARLMIEVCRERGLSVVPTATREDKIKDALRADPNYVWVPDVNDPEGVALDEDTCIRCGDERLELYGEFSKLRAIVSKDLPMLRGGVYYPIHTRYGMADSTRTTSSKPNVQNVRRLPGIRECFVPRAGHVFMQADLPAGELRTLAQSCIWLPSVGYSKLGDALNRGEDPHLMVAAQLLRISYAEAKVRHEVYEGGDPNNDKEIDNARQAGKVANFGFPGGLGYKAFVAFARATYRVIISEEEAKQLKKVWLATWPEMGDYFRHMGSLCDNPSGEALVIYPKSGGFRGRVRYTAACNTLFQKLLADATGEAYWLITKACYAEKQSPLYGSRIVNFIHDEWIGETPDDARASDAVKELCRLMIEGANRWVPDVPFTKVKPVLMSHWSKKAKSIVDADGTVRVWRGEKKAA